MKLQFIGHASVLARGRLLSDPWWQGPCFGAERSDVLTSRAHYVRSSLTTRYGYAILRMGSGGVFTYSLDRLSDDPRCRCRRSPRSSRAG